MAKKPAPVASASESNHSMEEAEQDDRFPMEEEDEDSDKEAGEDSSVATPNLIKQIKKKKHGIIYISSIPKYMTVSILREFLSEHADVGRIYLQASGPKGGDADKKKKKRKLKYRVFTEGWVELLSKRAAKAVAAALNGKPITTRKKSKFCDILWNMKYLPRFKWLHLSERLTYEKMVYQQRMRNEISQARKEANYFGANLDKSEFKKKREKKEAEGKGA